jgi:hypothetical protein
MTHKFQVGDPVWAMTFPDGRETAAIVATIAGTCPAGHTVYGLENEVLGFGHGCEPYIRPRRDDYQQHEPRVTRADIDQIINQPEPIEV